VIHATFVSLLTFVSASAPRASNAAARAAAPAGLVMLSKASSSSCALVERDAEATISARASSAHRAPSQRESGAADSRRLGGGAFFFSSFSSSALNSARRFAPARDPVSGSETSTLGRTSSGHQLQHANLGSGACSPRGAHAASFAARDARLISSRTSSSAVVSAREDTSS
jgi:hypothetical protein